MSHPPKVVQKTKDVPVFHPVVIIGAGCGGIGMACELKNKLGFEDVHIFERRSGVGGTWWSNRYPGVACDIPAVFYSFSFRQNPNWTTFYPSGPEIRAYLNSVVDEYGLRPKISLNTEVRACEWDARNQLWTLSARRLVPGTGDLSISEREAELKEYGTLCLEEYSISCKILVSAVGGLVEPAPWPSNVPGRDEFRGSIMHSAQWNSDIDLRDKDVVVVGTGCSAAQIVPKLLEQDIGARSVTQLMREPPWVVPRIAPPVGDKLWEMWSTLLCHYVPGFMSGMRLLASAATEFDFRLFGGGWFSDLERRRLQKGLIAHMKKNTPSKYHEILTPKYSVGCKRRIYDKAWFPSLSDPRVTLTTLALTEVKENSITLCPGPKTHASEREAGTVGIPADVIVLANGFAVHNWFHPLTVIGRDKTTLQEVFDARGGPQLYRATALDGFPNLFILFGPNSFTGHSSVILGLENQINHAIKLMRPVLRGDATTIEVKRNATLAYTNQIQKDLKSMVWNSSHCSSWYKTKDGHNFVSYPYSMIWHTLQFRFPTWAHWNVEFTQQGETCRWRKRCARKLLFLIFIGCIVFTAKVGPLRSLRLIRSNIRNLRL
ncbi:hypothetical protein B0J13DRAFT_644019 [Dactylonectria estremocensis]|uniref:Uncharacterized protein n=1 Tax=Dactylonectria estremocensis TaxID=1079267 RepID=A0A9P9FEH1_9HYPO|nr:hypothetical protein B0J13DRAFT_644019 [Dactylonectria estremocensis]